MSEVLTRAEVAKMLRIHYVALARMAQRGDGPPFFRVGRAVRYSLAAVLQWVQQQEIP